jgi:thymidylate synthase (FAD)
VKIKLLAHTRLADDFFAELPDELIECGLNDSAALSLIAIRTCYSPNAPSEILQLEAEKYFGAAATDGEGGSEADRLFRMITRSGHTSTLEHISYTFAIEGVSRSLLAQLTRHRQFSFSVQSQRYVRFGSGDKSGGMGVVVPHTIQDATNTGFIEDHGTMVETNADELFDYAVRTSQAVYDALRKLGIPAEDARFILPNAATCNLVMSCNLRALLEFYGKRKKGKGAQWEIAEFAEQIRSQVVKVDPWVNAYFNQQSQP